MVRGSRKAGSEVRTTAPSKVYSRALGASHSMKKLIRKEEQVGAIRDH